MNVKLSIEDCTKIAYFTEDKKMYGNLKVKLTFNLSYGYYVMVKRNSYFKTFCLPVRFSLVCKTVRDF